VANKSVAGSRFVRVVADKPGGTARAVIFAWKPGDYVFFVVEPRSGAEGYAEQWGLGFQENGGG